MKTIILGILLAGCSAAGEYQSYHSAGSVCLPTVLTPDERIFELVSTAAARWESAHGCPVEVADNGIPIHDWGFIFIQSDQFTLVQADPALQHKQLCGATRRGSDGDNMEIFISTAAQECDPAMNMVHELGHIWGMPGTHAEEGVCAPTLSKDHSLLITESSLNWVCEGLSCQAFYPEL